MRTNGIKQIAELAGCSCATVSRVLNNRAGISDPVREKILEIANRLDYANTKKKRIVALLVTLDADGFDEYSMHLMRMIVLELHKAGFYVNVLFNENIEILGENYISGIISINVYDNFASVNGRKFKVPMVCVNDYGNMEEDIHVVYSDDTKAVADATSYLMKCGHKSIYLLTNSADSMSNLNRIRAFKECIRNFGLEKTSGVLLARRRFLYTCPVDDYVKRLPPECTALISATEAFGPALYESLQRLRPDVTLLSWWFAWDKRINGLKIPYMHQNFKMLAKKAVEMLQRQIEGKQVVNTAVPYVFKKSGRKITL